MLLAGAVLFCGLLAAAGFVYLRVSGGFVRTKDGQVYIILPHR
jgi:hypothetical protein